MEYGFYMTVFFKRAATSNWEFEKLNFMPSNCSPKPEYLVSCLGKSSNSQTLERGKITLFQCLVQK